MYIGPYQLSNNLIVAPMAGVTDRPFRTLCKYFGAGHAVSEMMTSDKTLRMSKKSLYRANFDGELAPISAQIAGSDPRDLAEAARYQVANGAQIVDINMGCPAKKVCNKLSGSALLQDEDLVIWDSLAITEYVAERHTGVWPNAKAARAWARSASAEMHSGFYALRQQCPMNTGVRIRLHDHMAALQADLQRLEALWQEGLQRFGGPFLAGATFTAVDAFFAPVALRVQTYGLNLSPDAQAYCQRLLQLASMQQWQTEALQETCRDDEQEQDIPAIGTLLADYRHPQ